MEKDTIYNLIIVDESGSMSSIQQPTVDGFNMLLSNIKSSAKEFEDQIHKVSFVSFNSVNGVRFITDLSPAKEVKKVKYKEYNPDGGTPLYDVIGASVNRLRKQISEDQNAKVLVSIFTDGYENASKEFSVYYIQSMVRLLELEGWTFSYIGTDHDVESVAIQLNISNSMKFDKSEQGMKAMFKRENDSRKSFYNRVREKDTDLTINLFKKNK